MTPHRSTSGTDWVLVLAQGTLRSELARALSDKGLLVAEASCEEPPPFPGPAVLVPENMPGPLRARVRELLHRNPEWTAIPLLAVAAVEGSTAGPRPGDADPQWERAQAAVRRSEAILAQAGKMAHLGAWEIDFIYPDDRNENPLRWSDEVYRIFGYEPGSVAVTNDLFFERVHPDDRAGISEAVSAAIASGEPYSFEHRVIRPDGTERIVLEHAQIYFGEGGRPLRMIGAVQDITETRRTERELRAAKLSADQAKAAAEEASRTKDHFLAVLSHELRTPLTPVLASVSMMMDRPGIDEDTRRTLEIVRRNVEMEALLIDDLLDITRIARGRVDLDLRPVDLCDLVRSVVEVSAPEVRNRGLTLVLGPGTDVSSAVLGDPTRLHQVFRNLVKNAIKFTPEGGRIELRCVRDVPGRVVVEVADSGLGIDPAALGRIFDAFEQAEPSMAHRSGGLGLGLAISKALVELHGGSITASSAGRGKGSVFRVSLPLASPGTLPADVAGSAVSPRAPRRLRILLVEDHADTAQILRLALQTQGHSVESAADIATAQARLGAASFDLLISDLGLPDGTGIDLVRGLRASGSALPAIALSGYGQAEDIRRSREAGFAEHLVKPVSLERLVATISEVAAHS